MIDFEYAKMTPEGIVSDKPKTGRKRKFNVRLAKVVLFLYQKQFTDREVANVIGVSEALINKWKKSKSFLESIERAKDDPNAIIESKLFQRAHGMEYEEKTVEKDHKGNIKQKVVKKFLAPDVSAIRLWLINRRPKRWRSDFVIDQSNQTNVLGLLEFASNGNGNGKAGNGRHNTGTERKRISVI